MVNPSWVLVAAFLFPAIHRAEAQYVLELKNGRQIIVQSYREQGSMIKFGGLGGEVSISKDQVKTIFRQGQNEGGGLDISDLQRERAGSSPRPVEQRRQQSASNPVTRATDTSEESKVSPDLQQVEQYQKRLHELTRQLELANRAYFEATQGGGTASNVTNEGMRSWAMDLASRIHDSQKVPGGGGATSTPPMPPFAPTYTNKERELSKLREEIDRLQKERDSLVLEMKSKNIPTGRQ